MSGILEWYGVSVYEWDTGVVRSISVSVGYWSGTECQCMSGILEWYGISVYEWDTDVIWSISV